MENNIVIVGLCKNIGKYFHGSKKNLIKIASNFNKYKIILIENDSTDDTKKLIEEWSNEDSNVKLISFYNLNQMLNIKHRTESIAFCRNVAIQEIKMLDKKEYPYTLMVDMDDCLQSDKFTYEGVMSSIDYLKEDSSLAVVGAVIDGPYYDIYALRNEECHYNCWKMVFANLNKMSYDDAVKEFVNSHNKDYSKDPGLIYVDSLFGGAAVFKNELWVKSEYTGICDDGTEECEHVPMCLKLRKMGYKIAMNPKFILY